ncbi:MAG: hypothetical protein RR552_06000 [Oscillospiraceae bacterium]
MNGNAELLNFIYQNSEMGVETIKQLLKIANEEKFLSQLNFQLKEYEAINSDAKNLLNQNNFTEKDISAFEKLTTYLMINMKTMTDKSSQRIAEMMIIGSNMGIINAIKNIRKYSNAEKDIVDLMKKLLEFEENNVKALKIFL